MDNLSTVTSMLNAYSLPSALCSKHGVLLEASKSFNRLWPVAHEKNIKTMFLNQDRWQDDWRLVLRNQSIELLETRLCDPLSQYMLRTSRVEQHGNVPLFLIELHPRKELTGGFAKLANYHSETQRQKHRSHLISLQMKQAVKESHTDSLTGIANRRAFDERLQEVWQEAIKDRRSVMLFSADIDHFKMINDQLGHCRGDEILIQVAQRLDKVMSRSKDVVARVGGEEFAMVLPDTHPDGGLILARSVVEAIAELNIPHPDTSASGRVTISLGCTSIQPGPSNTIDEFIKAADDALYFAKHSGRNCASYMNPIQLSTRLISA
jgi:diguanylate cyclase (GGDEF)-like protein